MIIHGNCSNWVIEDQLDEKLIEKINNLIDRNLNSLLKLKEGFSTTGKNAEQYWLIKKSNDFYFKNKDFEDIKIDYKSQILNRLKKSGILNEKIVKKIIQEKVSLQNKNCWTVIGGENSYHTPHFHNDGDFDGISTTVYLKVPQTNIENEPENNLFLLMDGNVKNKFYYNNPSNIMINPVVGKLLIFPDWTVHGTCPQSKGIRQTFNIDYHFIHKKQNNNLNYG
jgi:hypothetical protein